MLADVVFPAAGAVLAWSLVGHLTRRRLLRLVLALGLLFAQELFSFGCWTIWQSGDVVGKTSPESSVYDLRFLREAGPPWLRWLWPDYGAPFLTLFRTPEPQISRIVLFALLAALLGLPGVARPAAVALPFVILGLLLNAGLAGTYFSQASGHSRLRGAPEPGPARLWEDAPGPDRRAPGHGRRRVAPRRGARLLEQPECAGPELPFPAAGADPFRHRRDCGPAAGRDRAARLAEPGSLPCRRRVLRQRAGPDEPAGAQREDGPDRDWERYVDYPLVFLGAAIVAAWLLRGARVGLPALYARCGAALFLVGSVLLTAQDRLFEQEYLVANLKSVAMRRAVEAVEAQGLRGATWLLADPARSLMLQARLERPHRTSPRYHELVPEAGRSAREARRSLGPAGAPTDARSSSTWRDGRGRPPRSLAS